MVREKAFQLERAVTEAIAAQTSPAYWRRVGRLQELGTRQVFDAAAKATKSKDPRRRELAADVLGELGYQSSVPPFRRESTPLLKELLRREKNPAILAAGIRALARLHVRSAFPYIVPFAKHKSENVRWVIAAELCWCTWDSGEERPDPDVTATLIDLTRDRKPTVRNWACFSLASSEQDSPEIRAALWRRVRDRHYDTRVEALRGLARRRDPRVRETLNEALRVIGFDRLGTWVIDDLVDYPKDVGDRKLVKALQPQAG